MPEGDAMTAPRRSRSVEAVSHPAAGITPRRGSIVCAATAALGLLAACDEKNSYVPPPPPLLVGLNESIAEALDARIIVLPPPPIQGIGNVGRLHDAEFELRDGSFDLAKQQSVTGNIVVSSARKLVIAIDGCRSPTWRSIG
jgi:hypothetical protein